MELFSVEVVGEDMEREDVFYGGEGVVLGEKVVHGGIVDGADSDCAAAVDLAGEVCGGEVVVEGGKLRVLGENSGNVVCIGGGDGGGEKEKEDS